MHNINRARGFLTHFIIILSAMKKNVFLVCVKINSVRLRKTISGLNPFLHRYIQEYRFSDGSQIALPTKNLSNLFIY